MTAVAFVSTVAAPVYFDYLTDRLSGLNVREYNYLADEVEVEIDPYYDDRFDSVLAPFAVMVWDDGLDYDMDGNAYFDDYPGDSPASFHRTRAGAEKAAAWLEYHGIKAQRISIVENYWTYKWELQYHPIEE